MENERKRTPSGYVWTSCPLKFDLRSNGSKLEREFDHALDDLDNPQNDDYETQIPYISRNCDRIISTCCNKL